jgi:beta-mannosidase
MTRKTISLNDSNWRFASVTQKPFGDVNDFAEARDWLPAQVPGDVRLDLLRAGKIADPFYAATNEDSQWVDARDWWYEKSVELELEAGERAFLVLEGVDYQSAVFWNGQPLGRHAGMFSRQVYELQTEDEGRGTRGALRPAPLAIRIWGSDALPKLEKTLWRRIWGRIVKPLFMPPSEPYPDRYATLKCQMQFGWDFAPRLRTCGIWDDAHLVVAKSVFIRDAFVKCQMPNDKLQIARVQVALTLDSDRAQDVRVQCSVRGKNFAGVAQTFAFDLPLERGIQRREISFDVRDARLWNPWDRGEPNLYEIETRVESADGTPLDARVETFGIRSFELVRAPGAPANAEPWTFVVNGKREFVRGANWVPLDAIPARVTRAAYAARLKQARDANVNFLRVWGGGLKEKRAFYDLCDEMGILVWQEFPFAGATLDRFPRDRAFLDFARDECSAIVRALRNHPALVVWCGGNEFNTRGHRAMVETLRGIVAREDGTRPFKPASPYRDESHNWAVWHRFANLRDYRKDQTPFLSEFGLQSLPNMESLKKFLPDEALAAPHALWEYHHAELKKLERYARPVIASREAAQHAPKKTTEMASQSPLPAMTTETLIDATQRAQAFGLHIAIEHMRRRKGAAAGVAVWQLNDAWPAISWSVIDYYGAPKRAYAALEKLYSPVLASFNDPLQPRKPGDRVRGELWLINDLLSSFQNAELCAYLNDTEIFRRRVNIAPDSATRLDALDVTLGEGENILRLKVSWGPAPLSDHTYDLNFCDVGEINAIGALLVAVGKRLMR